MTRLVLITTTQYDRPRMNVTLSKQSWYPNRWSAIHKDFLENSADTDKHCKKEVQRGILKYLGRKLLPSH